MYLIVVDKTQDHILTCVKNFKALESLTIKHVRNEMSSTSVHLKMSHSAFAKLGHISFQGENFLLITLKMIYVHEQLDINLFYMRFLFVCLFPHY